MPVITQTPRLTIQTFDPGDEDDYLALWADEQVRVHLPQRTAEETRKMFRETIVDDANGAIFSRWAIINKANSDPAGMGLLRLYNDDPGTLEVGYVLHVKYWGQGLATELTNALISYAKTFPQVSEIVAVTTLTNIPSQKVLEKAGLRRGDNVHRFDLELAFFQMEL